MSVYNTINENINRIRDFIFSDETTKRYLFYNSRPLDLEKDIPTIPQINLNHLYPYPNNPDVEDEAKSFINIYMFRSTNSGNTIHRNVSVFVDILCHETLWLLDDDSGSIRPYILADILDRNIPKIMTPAIRGNMIFSGLSYIQYNNRFCGYRLTYELTNFSEGCDFNV